MAPPPEKVSESDPEVSPLGACAGPERIVLPHDEASERGVIDLLGDLKAGRLNSKDISPSERQQCVMHLSAEGVANPEIAKILKVSDRTICRDKQAIREGQALRHDPALAGQIAGRLMAETETSISRIRRVTRERDAPHAVRVEGERVVMEIFEKTVRLAQSLGFLPSAAHRIEADLTHHLGNTTTSEDLRLELDRLDRIDQAQTPELAPPVVASEDTPPEASKSCSAEQVSSNSPSTKPRKGSKKRVKRPSPKA